MVTKLNILKGKLILNLNGGKMVEVKPFTKSHLIKGVGYYDKETASETNPYVYVYRGKFKKNSIKIPGSVYKTSSEKFMWIEHDENGKELFHLSKCKELSKDIIAAQLNDPNVKIKEITPELLDTVDGEIFAPQIRDSDDILKRIIKTVLQNMKINIKTLKSRFANDYDLNNLKSQLMKEGAMSSKYFTRWAEVLDINIEVIVRNMPGSNKLQGDEITIIMK